MKTRLSTKGQVVLPGALRRKLGLRSGDPLEVQIENGRVVLTPEKREVSKARIITDPLTRLPALIVGPDAPTLTSKHVREILADFP